MGEASQCKVLEALPCGRTVLRRSLDTLLAAGEASEVNVTASPSNIEAITAEIESVSSGVKLRVVVGGETRQESVANALSELKLQSELIVIHDAARPFVSAEDIQRVIHEASEYGAAILAKRISSTVKQVGSEGCIEKTIPRAALFAAETPQVFQREALHQAHRKAVRDGFQATDDAQLLERLGLPVRIVEATSENFKITLPEDLRRARLQA